MYFINDIRQIINDYHWKKRLIQSQVYEMDSTSTAQYGIDSAMPKGQGQTGDKISTMIIRNENQQRKIESLIKEVSFIDEHEHCINSDKNFHILQLLKQGESKQRIKVLLNMSNGNLYKRIDQIIIILFNSQPEAKEKDKKDWKEKNN
ncbi:hypothetical protein [Jeotgalicoccus sp. WY2]|uniref:hypothetical protein n=1 Tax=Jeotgalicoccus sp. WY2 TaxID=2708346 RepID=UPI001BD2CFAF|nr:hypothetical protein [Jeotgalicoccus sp. WY2]